jgi:hypothetical protein
MVAASPSYLCAVEAARAAGARDDEIVGCLLAVLPILGEPPVVSAAPKLGLALGYDVSAALEDAGRFRAERARRAGGAGRNAAASPSAPPTPCGAASRRTQRGRR